MTNSISGHRETRSRNKKVLPDQGVMKVFPDMGVTRVQIDHKTEIWIKEWQDPQERKDAFLKRLDKFRNQPDHL